MPFFVNVPEPVPVPENTPGFLPESRNYFLDTKVVRILG